LLQAEYLQRKFAGIFIRLSVNSFWQFAHGGLLMARITSRRNLIQRVQPRTSRRVCCRYFCCRVA
jgi:hypothetical protein